MTRYGNYKGKIMIKFILLLNNIIFKIKYKHHAKCKFKYWPL